MTDTTRDDRTLMWNLMAVTGCTEETAYNLAKDIVLNRVSMADALTIAQQSCWRVYD